MANQAIQKVSLDATQGGIQRELFQQDQPSQFDAERFSRLMESVRDKNPPNSPNTPDRQATESTAMPPVEATGASSGARSNKSTKSSMGDRILDSIQSVSVEFGKVMTTAGLNPDQPSPNPIASVTQILKTQMQLVKLSVSCDIVAKGTNQAAKSVNELTHLQ